MFEILKSCFGIYDTGYEYWLPVSQIVVTPEFRATTPSYSKYASKKRTFLKYGILPPIKLNRSFELVDGYISLLIMNEFDCGKVPVYFVD